MINLILYFGKLGVEFVRKKFKMLIDERKKINTNLFDQIKIEN